MHQATTPTQAGVVYLRQALDLIERLDDARYGETQPPVFTSSTGAQIRHAIEYYQCFFRGIPEGRIDYEDRPRDARIETSRAYATSVLEGLIQQLQDMPGEAIPRPLMIRVENGDSPELAWCESTLGRELDFLLSHTVHHLAIMALMLRGLGFDPGAELGMAPSTLRHLKRNLSCAR